MDIGEPQDSTHHFRWWSKSLWRDVEQVLHFEESLHQDRENTIGFGARTTGYPPGHLLLEHAYYLCYILLPFKDLEQDRRRDVVGKIADDRKSAFKGLRRFENVFLANLSLDGGIAFVEILHLLPIDFNSLVGNVVPFEKVLRYGAATRADLEQLQARLSRDAVHDLPADGVIMQEMLTETFFESVHGGDGAESAPIKDKPAGKLILWLPVTFAPSLNFHS